MRFAGTVSDALRTNWNNTTVIPPTVQDAFAVGVTAARKLVLQCEPSEVVFGPNLKATFQVKVDRVQGIDEAVTLALFPTQNGLPANVTGEKINPKQPADFVLAAS